MNRKSGRKRCLQAVREVLNRVGVSEQWRDFQLQGLAAKHPTTYSDAFTKVKAEQYRARGGTSVSPPLPPEEGDQA